MRRIAALALVGAALLGACNDDDEDDTATTTTAAPDGSTSTSSTIGIVDGTTVPPTGAGDPVAAVEDFVERFLPGSTVTLSEFRQGDNRSGEIDVLRPAEGGGTANVSTTLLLRLDDLDQWQVFAGTNPNVTIEQPQSGGDVERAPVTVSGVGRGFEGTLVGRAMLLDGTVVAEAVGAGGALADPIPYTIELDLTEVGPESPLVIVVSGGVGLEGDPGELSVARVIAR